MCTWIARHFHLNHCPICCTFGDIVIRGPTKFFVSEVLSSSKFLRRYFGEVFAVRYLWQVSLNFGLWQVGRVGGKMHKATVSKFYIKIFTIIIKVLNLLCRWQFWKKCTTFVENRQPILFTESCHVNTCGERSYLTIFMPFCPTYCKICYVLTSNIGLWDYSVHQRNPSQ